MQAQHTQSSSCHFRSDIPRTDAWMCMRKTLKASSATVGCRLTCGAVADFDANWKYASRPNSTFQLIRQKKIQLTAQNLELYKPLTSQKPPRPAQLPNLAWLLKSCGAELVGGVGILVVFVPGLSRGSSRSTGQGQRTSAP